MIRILLFTALTAGLVLNAPAQTPVNADFGQETGAWTDRDGPPGWELRLADDDQLGVVENIDFAFSGSNAFYFSHVHDGFGGSRLEQCIVLDQPVPLQLSVWATTDEPHPELAARLRIDFYADESCAEDSANADAEQVQSDIGLSAERAPAGQWVHLASAIRLPAELGDDVRSARISLRQRDRSDDGGPREPTRTVWFDQVTLTADVSQIPQAQQDALRALFEATGGQQWTHQLNWMGPEGTECTWYGITCNEAGDEVVRLSLPRNRLLGELPDEIENLAGLRTGEGLDLCWNDILVAEHLLDFVNQRHLGGDPGHCQGVEALAPHAGLSGSYFQPATRSGEGFMLHMLSAGSALIYWATYDDHGDPVWLFGQGRSHDRVLQFEDLYQTSGADGIEVQRVGRASLVFAPDAADPDCVLALVRFQAENEGYAAGSGRELSNLEGRYRCGNTSLHERSLTELEGVWFDPASAGQGLSLMPHGDDRLLLNWYLHDDQGNQRWRIGTGVPAADGQSIEFGPLLEVTGGNFDQMIDPASLQMTSLGEASLVRQGDNWQFVFSDQAETVALDLQRIVAGPDLLASSGQRLDLSMQPADVEELFTRSIFSDERLPGQVRFNSESEVQDLTGLRFRGNTSRHHPKKSYNIRFEHSQDLLYGSDRMNLNAMYTDPSMMRESLSFELFHQLGQPASRTRHFDFWLNGIYEGLHIHIQRVDEWLLSMNGLNPDGTLVRDEFRDNADLPSSVFGYHFPGMDDAERLELLQTNFNFRGDPQWERLLELIDWVDSTPSGASYASGFEQRINLDNFIDWLVLHWLIGDIDSFADDFWLYLDHDDPQARWHFIPWDKDQSFGSHFRPDWYTDNDFFAYEYPLEGGWGNLLIDRFLETPSLRQAAHQRLIELIDEVFTESWLHQRIDEHAELLEDSASIRPSETAFHLHNQNHHGELGRYQDHVESVRDYVSLRYRFIRRQLTPSVGPIDRAQGDLEAGSEQPLFLTDVSGFSLASIRPIDPLDATVTFHLTVEHDPAVTGIDRVWNLTVTGEPGPVELTLFYRNEISPHWGRGNWYTGGDVPVGQQDLLEMIIEPVDGQAETYPTRVNPMSNKAVTVFSPSEGEYRLWLNLPTE